MITFEQYLAKKGVKLRPWQQRAAAGLLLPMFPNRDGATGKTQLLKWLAEFIDEHGSNFLLDDGTKYPVKPVSAKRKLFMR